MGADADYDALVQVIGELDPTAQCAPQCDKTFGPGGKNPEHFLLVGMYPGAVEEFLGGKVMLMQPAHRWILHPCSAPLTVPPEWKDHVARADVYSVSMPEDN